MRDNIKWILVATTLAAFCFGTPAAATTADGAATDKYYVIVVANNHALDEDLAPLRFADDDGAKYFELFRAAGAEIALLAVLDPDAQKRFPEAAAQAVPPMRATLLDKTETFFDQMKRDQQAGTRTHFVFVYSGHGSVGPNREGYLYLTDSRFKRSELFRDILAKSPATFNHIILDACHAYYMVNKKGKGDKQGDYTEAVRSFLSTEELRRYPNTGVILAASSESETHEWGKWESGIFSHELRSALLGSADVNDDGRITYAEAASCVEAANAAIDIPKARLKVFYQAPATDIDLPIITREAFTRTGTGKIRFPKEMADQYHIEDARGVRIADFNYSSEQPLTIALPGTAPFFVRTNATESSVEDSENDILASNLTFENLATASRGSVERSFRKDLYSIPFGMGFYRGAQAVLPTNPAPPPEVTLSDRADGKRTVNTWGWITLGTGVASGIGSAVSYVMAQRAYGKYQDAPDPSQADGYQEDTENRLLTSRVLLGVGSALAVTGAAMLIIDTVKKKNGASRSTGPTVSANDTGVIMGIHGSF